MKEKKGRARFVLDSYAVLTYLKEEPGWEMVKKILWSAYQKNCVVFMSLVNLGELYYIACREFGPLLADKAVGLVRLWPVKFVPVNEEYAIAAGRLKAENHISYADAYVAATALLKRGAIVTGDPEFKNLADIVKINWLPKNR